MWSWVDGHMVLVVLLVWPVSWLLVALENGRRARRDRRDAARAAHRRQILASRGGAS